MDTGSFRTSIKDIVDLRLVEDGIDHLAWRDFGNGLSMARLARQGTRELVLYRIAADAAPVAFLKHEHVGGEFYLVLQGKIADETDEYEQGDIVYLAANSVHTPHAIGNTLVLVLWPEGVRLVAEEKERVKRHGRPNENFRVYRNRRNGQWDGGQFDHSGTPVGDQ